MDLQLRTPAKAALDALPWSEVVRSGKPRLTRSLPLTSVHTDFYLDWRISKLRHRNSTFRRQTDVYAMACKMCVLLVPFRMDYSLWEAHEIAVYDQRLLRDDVTQDVITLCGLITFPVCNEVDHLQPGEAARVKFDLNDSPLRKHPADHAHLRWHWDLSSGRGASKSTSVWRPWGAILCAPPS